MKIVETVYCSNCGADSVDILIEDNEVKVIGGCVNCDYMPMIEEVNEALGIEEDYRGIDEMAIVSEWY
jgi:hypothetical protein